MENATSPNEEAHHYSRYNGSNLIFMVGSPRSGTTYLQRLLSSHPDVKSGSESWLFSYIGPFYRLYERQLQNARPDGLGCYLDEEEFYQLRAEILDRLLDRITEEVGPGQLFLEKSPGHALYLSEIHKALPQARIIHILRDGRDAVASMLAASREWGNNWAPRHAGAAAHHWAIHVEAAQAGRALFGEEQFLEVRYEDLLSDPVPTLQQCARLMKLAWSEAAMHEALEANRADKARASQTSGTPIELRGAAKNRQIQKGGTTSLSEPKNFIRRAQSGGWKHDLSLLEKLLVQRRAGALLRRCNYR